MLQKQTILQDFSGFAQVFLSQAPCPTEIQISLLAIVTQKLNAENSFSTSV